ncbi:DNA polymerase I [Alphaproteobacteria bacterium]|nr:DNA polymerase I [Alphaproteobacteria bacterium]
MKKIALIDAYGFVFRAYHSLPPLLRKDQTPVGAVFGFTNMLIKLLAGLNVSHVAVVFDSGSKTFRNEIYPAYKANRPECPEDLKPQFAIVRQATQALNLKSIEKVGYEADDIIATLAKQSAQQGFEVLIVSSDKDLMQLIDDKISMYDAMKNKIIKEPEVIEKFMVPARQVLDILSLIGDSSDNIPGVKGIGPKTASELLKKFGNIENIFANLSEITQEKKRLLLERGIDDAMISKKLARLDDKVELDLTLDDLQLQAINPEKLINFLKEQEFYSLMNRVKKEFNLNIENTKQVSNQNIDDYQNNLSPKNNKKKIIYQKITEFSQLKNIHQQAKNNGLIVIDYFLINNQIDIVTLSLQIENKDIIEVFYLKINDNNNNQKNQNLDLFSNENFIPNNSSNNNNNLDLSSLFEILNDNSIRKIFFKSKDFLKEIINFNNNSQIKININNIVFDDLELMSYVLNSTNKKTLRELIDSELDSDIEELGYGKIFDDIQKNIVPEKFSEQDFKINFLCFSNVKIFELYQILKNKLFIAKQTNSYQNYQLPLIKVLADMESKGVKIDLLKLQKLSHEFGEKIKSLTSEIYKLAGQEFNISSSQQLAEILFNKLGLHSTKKSKKTQALSTAVKVLEELAEEGSMIALKIIEFRKFSKLKNTYSDGLQKELNFKTNRVHTHFSNTATFTGRLNSINPNLQNLPIKTPEGRMIRQCFIADKNYSLISADYSQIELRIIAHIAKIENLIKAFKDNKDIHTITACDVFNVTENQVDDNLRNKAKAINFGIIYGISAFGLAKQLKISNSEADQYIKSYLNSYRGIDDHMKNSIKFAEENGYVCTISGRKIFIPDIASKNPIIRNEGKRKAINAPIQGSCADIINKAMINIYQKFTAKNLKSKMLLQIHDELVFEIANDEREIAKKIISEEMEQSYNLDVALKVEISDFI